MFITLHRNKRLSQMIFKDPLQETWANSMISILPLKVFVCLLRKKTTLAFTLLASLKDNGRPCTLRHAVMLHPAQCKLQMHKCSIGQPLPQSRGYQISLGRMVSSSGCGRTSSIGNIYGTTTLSYAPSDLHSMKYNLTLYGTTSVSAIGQKWNTINYADLISKCTGLPFSNPGWSDGNEVWQNWMYVVKHCKPFLQDSPALGLVDPAWAKCDQRVAMYDPPRALIPGRALGPAPPAPTRDTSVSAAAAVAAPASQAAKPIPTPTPAPSIPALVSSSKSDPLSGSSNDPESAKASAAENPQQNPKGGPADERRPQNIDSQRGEPAPAPAPSVTTIAGQSIQVPAAQSSVGLVLVDGQSITAGHHPTTVSSTQIALHTNGDLVLGSSTVQSFLQPSSFGKYTLHHHGCGPCP